MYRKYILLQLSKKKGVVKMTTLVLAKDRKLNNKNVILNLKYQYLPLNKHLVFVKSCGQTTVGQIWIFFFKRCVWQVEGLIVVNSLHVHTQCKINFHSYILFEAILLYHGKENKPELNKKMNDVSWIYFCTWKKKMWCLCTEMCVIK